MTHLWHDWWHPVGPLIQVFFACIIHLFRSSENAKASSVIHNGAWAWPTGRRYTGEVVQLVTATPPSLVPVPGQLDAATWIVDSKGCYTARSAHKQFTTPGSSVFRSKMERGQKHVLRHTFILWLACKNRLATKDC
nr:uncharacterized protein LOC113690603 [Coffea arabica]